MFASQPHPPPPKRQDRILLLQTVTHYTVGLNTKPTEDVTDKRPGTFVGRER